MCLNKRWITNRYDGRRYLVSCGHCPACLQEKAVRRTNRIRYNFPKDKDTIALFVTLTYENKYIPYIRYSDLSTAVEHHNLGIPSLRKDITTYLDVPVYRDAEVRRNRVGSSYYFKKVTTYVTNQIDTYYLGKEFINFTPKYLKGQDADKIGVLYYPDIQNFFKNLRIYCYRHYGYESFSYFSCSEYGPNTLRPHFHLLIFIPQAWVKNFKSAIVACWSFAHSYLTSNNISIAKDAASYVSSYVNCDASVPEIFTTSRQASPHHSYSHGFGTALELFSLQKVYEAFRRRDMSVIVQRMRNGALVSDNILYPKYVISRYVPKFTGYNRLTPHEISLLVSGCCPISEINRFKRTLGWTDDYCRQLLTMLSNKRKMFLSNGISVYDFADMYSNVYSVYASNLLKRSLEIINCPIQNFYAYDNIIEYFDSNVVDESLDGLLSYIDENAIILDPNLFPQNVGKHNNLTSAYHSYSKDRKIRNIVYEKYLM